MPTNLADKDAIREVLAEYCFRLDGSHFAEMAALFTADGTWDTAFGSATGRDAIAALAGNIMQTNPNPPRRVHLVSNIVVELNGDGAHVRSNWVLVQNSEQGPKVGSAGGYQDRMVKRDGRWLFQLRKIDRFIA